MDRLWDVPVPLAPDGLSFWHERYQQQAGWTRSIRARLLSAAGITSTSRLLEVGSGTGAVTADAAQLAPDRTYGLDIDPASNAFAAARLPLVGFVTGDGMHLPFCRGAFDATFCHFVLLWVLDPAQVLREMVRVTAPRGWIGCLAEPDYGGRLDYPPELSVLGQWQIESLLRQGARPETGRTLIGLLHQAGLEQVEGGVLGAQWTSDEIRHPDPTEWKTLRLDLAGTPHEARLADLERAEQHARLEGSRVLYVPTFYAHGRVPAPN